MFVSFFIKEGYCSYDLAQNYLNIRLFPKAYRYKEVFIRKNQKINCRIISAVMKKIGEIPWIFAHIGDNEYDSRHTKSIMLSK